MPVAWDHAARRQVLIELAKAGLLDAERQLLVRSSSQSVVHRLLTEWQAPAQVLSAAGIPVLRLTTDVFLPDQEVQRQVSLHLTALGLEPAPIMWVSEYVALNLWLAPSWTRFFNAVPRTWTYPPLWGSAAKIVYLFDQPAWEPLARLIAHNVMPIGLATTIGSRATGPIFYVYDPNGERIADRLPVGVAVFDTEESSPAAGEA